MDQVETDDVSRARNGSDGDVQLVNHGDTMNQTETDNATW